MFLNQLMASEVFFHWFTFVLFSSDLLILSKICLLILPISDFDGLISLNDGELGNPSLWSFAEKLLFLATAGFCHLILVFRQSFLLQNLFRI